MNHNLGRNEPCHCNSNKKYKHCCLEKDKKLKLLDQLLYYDLTHEDKKVLGVNIEISRYDAEIIEPQFRRYAIQRTTKLLIQSTVPGFPYYMSGSGSFFYYRGKHFLITCEHCVRDVDPIDRTSIVKAPCNKEDGMTVTRFISHARDVDMDLAVFEIDSKTCHPDYFVGHDFVIEKQIKKDYNNYLKNQNNVILLCGSSSDKSSGIDYETGTGIISNSVIITSYNGYNNEIDLLNINVSNIGFKIGGGYGGVNEVNGLSGSWVYCYQKGEKNPFKGIGILVRGKIDSGNMWALGIDKITSFIDSQYFS